MEHPMTTLRLTRKQARAVACLLSRHTITTAADLVGMTSAEVAELRRVAGLRLDGGGRLMDPAAVIERLVDASLDAWDRVDNCPSCQRRIEWEQVRAERKANAVPRGCGIYAADIGADPVEVRAWAASVGLTVAPKGRLSRDVLEAYAASQQVVTA